MIENKREEDYDKLVLGVIQSKEYDEDIDKLYKNLE